MVALTPEQLVAIRMRNQLLTDPRPQQVADAVRRIGALQAQSTAAVRMAVRVRTDGVTQGDFDEALTASRTIVRTWLMRGTIHLVTAEDIGWMVELIGPSIRARYRRRREQLGLTDALCERALDALPRILTGASPMPLTQVMARLAEHGVLIDTTEQAPTHLMVLAATHGLVCRGPEAGRAPTFALTDEWVAPGPRLDRDAALARLARVYLAGRGPATVGDFGTWSALAAGDCRRAFDLLQPDLVKVDVAGIAMSALIDTELTAPADNPPRLLALWDEYLLSHRTRELILDPAVADRILVGGVIQAALVVDGRVAGLWRMQGSGRRRRLVIEPLVKLSRATWRAIDSEAHDIGRFLNVDVQVEPTCQDAASNPKKSTLDQW